MKSNDAATVRPNFSQGKMKIIRLICMLLLAGSVLGADETPEVILLLQKLRAGGVRSAYETSKVPFYIDCWSNSVTLYPGATNVTWESLQQPGNPVEKLLDQVQANNNAKSVAVLARPDSVQVFRQVRKMVGVRQIDVSYDVVDAGQKLGATNTPSPAVHIGRAPAGMEKQPMFFECRNEQVFFVDKIELDEKIAQMLAALKPGEFNGDPNGFVKATSRNEIGNAYYKVVPSYLAAMIMAIELKPGARGDDKNALPDPNRNFQRWLRKFNSNTTYLLFVVRDDSFNIFRQAREIADKVGFEVNWELLKRDEPIKFGNNGKITTDP